MGTHWVDKRSAMAMVGKELRGRGWTLYGWKADESDMQSDYYSPEDWDGIAERDGVVVVVDHSDTRNSGGRELHRTVPDGPCTACKGSLLEAGAPTFELMKKRAQEDGTALSPIPYFGACHNSPPVPEGRPELRGGLACKRCGGRGFTYRSETYTEPWPTFQANPKGRVWHIEREGRILASGVGVFAVASEKYGNEHPKLAALCDRIEAAAFPEKSAQYSGDAASAVVAADGVTIGPGTRPGYVEIRFPAKPAPEVLSELKAAGFRWSKFSACWYGLGTRLPERFQSEGFKAERARLDAVYESPDNVCPDGPTCTDPECVAARAERAS